MRALVFSGTSEGKEITEYLSRKKIETCVCVATEYGKEVMEEMPFVNVHIGRLNKEQMKEFIECFDFVIDATHPYAAQATENIKCVCREKGILYVRLLRDEIKCANALTAESVEKAAEILKNTEGTIFVSTGSKELERYTAIENYKSRIAARVLPVKEAMEKCNALGIEKIIYKKGPFGYDENIADFKSTDAKWLVTKSSGKAGGFEEKINAAKKLNMNIIVIKRPESGKDGGLNMEDVKRIIDKKTEKYMRFPMFIDISGKRVLVVGGGKIAARRVRTLLKFGAEIDVLSIDFDESLDCKNVRCIKKEFDEKCISDDYFFVIGATDSRKVNHMIYNACMNKNMLVNIADCHEECNFYFPAVCLSDDLSIGVVSDGEKHSLVKETAQKIRKLIED